MNNSVQQTALAFITVYKALPENVREEVRQLMQEIDKNELKPIDEWQDLSQASFAEEWDNPENDFWDTYLRTSNPTGDNV
jgi:hypothetical protein